MAVTLNGLTLTRLLNWEDEETTTVAVHGWINEATIANNFDTNVWNRELTRIVLTCRVNDCDKNSIETSANGLTTVTLNDSGTAYTVWIYRISAKYKASECWLAPWLLEIELIVQ